MSRMVKGPESSLWNEFQMVMLAWKNFGIGTWFLVMLQVGKEDQLLQISLETTMMAPEVEMWGQKSWRWAHFGVDFEQSAEWEEVVVLGLYPEA